MLIIFISVRLENDILCRDFRGEKIGIKKVAKAMKMQNIAIEVISAATGLTIQEIENL